MLPFLAPYLTELWGPFRLFGSYMVLIGLGTGMAALVSWYWLPRLWNRLPVDRGREHAVNAEQAKGKPTGGGILVVLLLLPCLLFVLPFSARLWEIVACLLLCMVTGYMDDRSPNPWGEYFKGSLDLVLAFLTSLALCQGQAMIIWLPFFKDGFALPAWAFVMLGTIILWFTINATNCSDGIDGLAGTLTLLSLFYLGAFLYGVVGHFDVAKYLLIPHNPLGAGWAILVLTTAGALAGYVWHNAQPSAILMGDAGSRFLGLLVGIAVLVAGNPLLVLVMCPVVLINGGTGLLKVLLLRVLRHLGMDTRAPTVVAAEHRQAETTDGNKTNPHDQHYVVRALHSIRFPLHDHCRHRLGWSNPQVLLRFLLLQAFLTPLLLVLLVKLR